MSREAGKGSKQRPTNHEQYSSNWDRIFKDKNKEEKDDREDKDISGEKHEREGRDSSHN